MLPLGMIHIFVPVSSGHMFSQSSLPASSAEINVMIYEEKCLENPILHSSERKSCLIMSLMIISNFFRRTHVSFKAWLITVFKLLIRLEGGYSHRDVIDYVLINHKCTMKLLAQYSC